MPPGLPFACDEGLEAVIPAHMALIRQIDDELGRLFAWLGSDQLLHRFRHRTAESDASVNARTGAEEVLGIHIGRWT